MSEHGTPGQVRPGFVVRIKLSSSICYTSKRVTRDEALALARDLVTSLHSYPAPLRVEQGFVEFPAADYEELLIRATEIKAVEVRRITIDGGLYPAPASEPATHTASGAVSTVLTGPGGTNPGPVQFVGTGTGGNR